MIRQIEVRVGHIQETQSEKVTTTNTIRTEFTTDSTDSMNSKPINI